MTDKFAHQAWSRRNFLMSTAAFALVPSVLAETSAEITKNGKLFAYAGT